ncbi:hypothetical protein, partial [Vibrio parahaemolyticus]
SDRLSFGRLPLTLSRLALAVTLSTSQVVVMIVLETEVQNVNVKTLTLRHFAVSHVPAFKLCYITTTDIFEEVVVPFNHFGYCISTFENNQESFGYLSVGDYEFRFESDEHEVLCRFLGMTPSKATALEAQ